MRVLLSERGPDSSTDAEIPPHIIQVTLRLCLSSADACQVIVSHCVARIVGAYGGHVHMVGADIQPCMAGQVLRNWAS